jgi:hypothetical protein
MTPEVTGEAGSARAQATYSNSVKYKLASLEQAAIFSSNINVSTESGTNKDNILNLTAAVGLGNALELMYRSYRDSPDLFGAKVQLIGRGEKDKEGLRLSLFTGYGASEVDNKSITATNGSGSSRSYQATLDIKAFEAGASIGYRVNKNVIPYLSYTFRNYEADANLTSDSYDNQSIKGTAKLNQASFGVQVNANTKQPIYTLLEAGYVKSTWAGADSREDYTLGASVGILFY